MNKTQTLKMLNEQAEIWNTMYTESKAKDAGLVLSVIESLIYAVNTGTQYTEGEYAGSVACHGSDRLTASVFKKSA